MSEHQKTQHPKNLESCSQRLTTFKKQTHITNPAAIIQHARINPKSLTSADVLQLQRTIGNRAVDRFLSEVGSLFSIAQNTPIQRQEIPEKEKTIQGMFEEKPEQSICPSCSIPSIQRKEENRTGMPDNLKAGVENLSGIDMSDVRVHYNSSKPAEIGALAYTQGTDIHVALGQERHLPHEAWHVVQQAQGRVRPTFQMKDVVVNDDKGLELEADVMGSKAMHMRRMKEDISKVATSSVTQKKRNLPQKFGLLDKWPEAVTQKKIQNMVCNNVKTLQLIQFNKFRNSEMMVSSIQPIQRWEAKDLVFMFRENYGLRHLGSYESAEFESKNRVKGDAVPLNPIGETKQPLPLMGYGELAPEVINKFKIQVENFIGKSLNRTITIKLGETTPNQLVDSAVKKSTFLLIRGLEGAISPRDVDKRDYGGLGKVGQQDFEPRQVTGIITFENNDRDYMRNIYSKTWDMPIISRSDGDSIYKDLISLFSSKIEKKITELRTDAGK